MTLFFVQAGETVRRRFAPAHVEDGVARGYDARVGPLADAVRRAWTLHVRGDSGTGEALREIVEAATKS